jgi:hypothetical protein
MIANRVRIFATEVLLLMKAAAQEAARLLLTSSQLAFM